MIVLELRALLVRLTDQNVPELPSTASAPDAVAVTLPVLVTVKGLSAWANLTVPLIAELIVLAMRLVPP